MLRDGLRDEQFDAIVVYLATNVLLLTGYFPVVGTSVAVATVDGTITLLVPEDERELAEAGGADEVLTFQPASLQRLTTAAEAIQRPLSELLRRHKLDRAVIGYEVGAWHEPSSYASMHLYGDTICEAGGTATLRSASKLLHRQRATLTTREIECVRRACKATAHAFETGKQELKPGTVEAVAAAQFRTPLYCLGTGVDGIARADGYVWCMAGDNSSKAHGAFAQSTVATIRRGDFVLTHCNSHAGGYWTDVTRTYCMGEPDERQKRMYDAVLHARDAGLATIRPGALCRDVDRAVRDVMRSYELGDSFKHSTGHGVGFAAIDPNALPRLHPASEDRLEQGMVFNLEPASYISGVGGLRHCDVVVATASGVEVLTPFDARLEDLIR